MTHDSRRQEPAGAESSAAGSRKPEKKFGPGIGAAVWLNETDDGQRQFRSYVAYVVMWRPTEIRLRRLNTLTLHSSDSVGSFVLASPTSLKIPSFIGMSHARRLGVELARRHLNGE